MEFNKFNLELKEEFRQKKENRIVELINSLNKNQSLEILKDIQNFIGESIKNLENEIYEDNYDSILHIDNFLEEVEEWDEMKKANTDEFPYYSKEFNIILLALFR